MDSLTFLDRVSRLKLQPIYVLHGDELFLKRQVLTALRTCVLGPDPEPLGLSSYSGDKVRFSTVHNDLSTVPFFSPRRPTVSIGPQALPVYLPGSFQCSTLRFWMS